MPKINLHPPLSSPDDADVFPIDDMSTTNKDTKSLSLLGLLEWLQSKVQWVTPSMIYNTHCFSATSTDTIPYVTTTYVKMTFNALVYNPDGAFSLANDRYVAPVKGVYHFDAATRTVDGNESVFILIYVNGVAERAVRPADFKALVGSVYSASISADIPLEVDDYVEIYVWTDDGADSNGASHENWFNGHLITELP